MHSGKVLPPRQVRHLQAASYHNCTCMSIWYTFKVSGKWRQWPHGRARAMQVPCRHVPQHELAQHSCSCAMPVAPQNNSRRRLQTLQVEPVDHCPEHDQEQAGTHMCDALGFANCTVVTHMHCTGSHTEYQCLHKCQQTPVLDAAACVGARAVVEAFAGLVKCARQGSHLWTSSTIVTKPIGSSARCSCSPFFGRQHHQHCQALLGKQAAPT